MSSNSPVSTTRLRQICNDACDSALSTSTAYDHGSTQDWNNGIINNILKSLISESSAGEQQPKYKFAVNSTIIQHLSDARSSGSDLGGQTDGAVKNEDDTITLDTSASSKQVGRRGMHSAIGAYWNNEKDGMWSHKYEGGVDKGMDIVISIMWIGV